MSAVYLVVVGVMALSLASFAWAIHKAEDEPWPMVDQWEAEKDAAWDEHVLQAVALNESPRPFDSPVKDRIAAQIAANRAQFLDAEWADWNGEGA